MKKLLILLLLVCLGWVGWLSYDVSRISAQQTQLTEALHAAERTSATLNDQLVRMQRLTEAAREPVADSQRTSDAAEQKDVSTALVKQQLDLIEFALHQQKYPLALEKLTGLENELNDYLLAPALRQSLKQAVVRDRTTVEQFVDSRSVQLAHLTRLMQQVDILLSREIKKRQPVPAQVQSAHFWQKWLTVESAQEPSVALMQRDIILKEAQLHLLLARQLMGNGLYVEYQQELSQVMNVLQQLPDQQARVLVQQLNKIRQEAVIPVPVLSTRALLG